MQISMFLSVMYERFDRVNIPDRYHIGMRGDLYTLKKVCKYASTVMLAGVVIFAILAIVTAVFGIGALFSESMLERLCGWVGVGRDQSTLVITASFFQMLAIYIMGIITVYSVYKIMSTIMSNYTPFTSENAKRIKTISLTFLFSSALLLILGVLAQRSITEIAFMFFGCLLVSVVLYCLTIVCRYGVILQDESDHTL